MGANRGIQRGSSSGARTKEYSESESAGLLNEESSSTSLSSCNANETSSEKTASRLDDRIGEESVTV
jgi:hypothetical protein